VLADLVIGGGIIGLLLVILLLIFIFKAL